jgi:hypothetical protein
MHRLSPRAQASYDKARAERKLCTDWLIALMRASPQKTRTKADLRAEAMARFSVSQSSFDTAWGIAIETTGNHSWYDPLPRGKKATEPRRLH